MNKRKGDLSRKVEELLREAALMYARLGTNTNTNTNTDINTNTYQYQY